jgi:hypothetical protein
VRVKKKRQKGNTHCTKKGAAVKKQSVVVKLDGPAYNLVEQFRLASSNLEWYPQSKPRGIETSTLILTARTEQILLHLTCMLLFIGVISLSLSSGRAREAVNFSGFSLTAATLFPQKKKLQYSCEVKVKRKESPTKQSHTDSCSRW